MLSTLVDKPFFMRSRRCVRDLIPRPINFFGSRTGLLRSLPNATSKADSPRATITNMNPRFVRARKICFARRIEFCGEAQLINSFARLLKRRSRDFFQACDLVEK